MAQVVDEAVVGEHEKILLYGAPKTGKTFAAATAPGNIYFLVIGNDNEIKTVQSPDFLDKYPEKRGRIAFDSVTETRGDRGSFEQARAFDEACDLLDQAIEEDEAGDFVLDGGIDTIVIDNATMLNTVQMNKAIEFNHARQSSKNKTTLTQLKEEGLLIPGDNDWMSQMSLMSKFVTWLFRLNYHVIFVAHEWKETSYDRSTRQRSVNKVRPLFTGKHREDIPMMFDNVWRMTAEGGGRSRRYCATTQGNEKVLAGTRFGGVLNEKIRDLDISEAIEKMQSVAQEES